MKALFVGLCAAIVVTQAAMAATSDTAAEAQRKAKREQRAGTTETRLEREPGAARRQRAVLQRSLPARAARRREKAPPRLAICGVFGHYCKEAVAVAWCESRLQTTARNGQYLGLFQMGSQARRLFGHGSTAYSQAVAAHKYFVSSGRDWSPWRCRPGYV